MDTASDHHPEGVDENGNKANIKGGPRELYLVTAKTVDLRQGMRALNEKVATECWNE